MADQSLLDSPISARDYKYIKDSYFSQNHPDVNKEDLSLFQGSYMRGELAPDAQKKAEYLLALLDADRSTLSQQQHMSGHQIGRPQAASSPKMSSIVEQDTSAAQGINAVEPSTGSISNQTPSFHKHSMRADQSKGPPAELSIHSLREKLASSMSRQTNYQPARVQEVEDSYLKSLAASAQTESLNAASQEITPSPLRHATQQQFWTAKQTWEADKRAWSAEPNLPLPQTLHNAHMMESMIASLGVLSPIRRRSLQPDQTVSHACLSPELKSENVLTVDEGDETAAATRGDLTRKLSDDLQEQQSDADARSALSKVDATSLQNAIQSALKLTVPSNMSGAQSQQGTLGASIAARFRASRGSFGNVSGTEAPLVDLATPVKLPVQHRVPSLGLQVLEPLKQGSPLQGQASARQTPELRRVDSDKENDAALSSAEGATQARVSEKDLHSLVERLEQAEQECSRRGLIIDTLVQHSMQANADPTRLDADGDAVTPVEDARAAAEAARIFELEQARQQMSEMKAAMQALMQQQQQQHEQRRQAHQVNLSAAQVHRQDARNEWRPSSVPSIQQIANDLTTAPMHDIQGESAGTPLVRVPVDAQDGPVGDEMRRFAQEESIADKMRRWDQSLQAEPDITHPNIGQQRRNETPSYIRDYKRRAAAYESPVSASGHVVPEMRTPIQQQSMRHVERLPLSPLSAGGSIRADTPVSQLHQRLSSTPSTKPLLASSMPDYDARRSVGPSRLYEELQLAQVDAMDVHTRGNLIKNIAIQLGVPLEKLSSTVCALGRESAQQEILVHETMKLRLFAERVHAVLYGGTRMEGSKADESCLTAMADRIAQTVHAVKVLVSRQSTPGVAYASL